MKQVVPEIINSFISVAHWFRNHESDDWTRSRGKHTLMSGGTDAAMLMKGAQNILLRHRTRYGFSLDARLFFPVLIRKASREFI